MKLGNFSISLAVSDIEASRVFYENLGFAIVGGEQSQNWLIMQNDTASIGLFQGLFDKNILTFNPGWDAEGHDIDSFTDIRELQADFERRGVPFESKIDAPDSGPASFVVLDPDGNQILVDQHR